MMTELRANFGSTSTTLRQGAVPDVRCDVGRSEEITARRRIVHIIKPEECKSWNQYAGPALFLVT